MIPLYWYGSFLNREIEQNWAAKMYQLDFEGRRNRLTHNMIMEHFESHVEKVQAIFDEVQHEGFEKAFEYEIKNPFTEYIIDPTPFQNEEFWAEYAEYSGLTYEVDKLIEHSDLSFSQRKDIEKRLFRRKTPFAPYKYLSQVTYFDQRPIEHTYINPFETAVLGGENTQTLPIAKEE
jgi:hypothetical protein